MRIRPSHPDAVAQQPAWVPLNGALHTQRADFDALRHRRCEELPERFECDHVEPVGPDRPPPMAGRSVTWTLSRASSKTTSIGRPSPTASTTTVIDGEAATSLGADGARCSPTYPQAGRGPSTASQTVPGWRRRGRPGTWR